MRYIDADKLIDKIFPIGLVDDGKYTINAKAVKVAIDKMPTADVVPKREVDRLKEINAGLSLALLFECEPTKELLSELEKTVREKVAREIIEELKKVMIDEYRYPIIAELKKKYTEGE